LSFLQGLKNLPIENLTRPAPEVGEKCDSTKPFMLSSRPTQEKQRRVGAACDFRSLRGRFPEHPVLTNLSVDLLSDGVRGICSAIAEYGIRVKDKAFSKD